jgi:hypothetical protein
MSGDKQRKKDHERKEHKVKRRQRDFEQPITRSVTPERGQAVSNFTDGEIAGPDHDRENEER